MEDAYGFLRSFGGRKQGSEKRIVNDSTANKFKFREEVSDYTCKRGSELNAELHSPLLHHVTRMQRNVHMK
jgi:hypothetical protein